MFSFHRIAGTKDLLEVQSGEYKNLKYKHMKVLFQETFRNILRTLSDY